MSPKVIPIGHTCSPGMHWSHGSDKADEYVMTEAPCGTCTCTLAGAPIGSSPLATISQAFGFDFAVQVQQNFGQAPKGVSLTGASDDNPQRKAISELTGRRGRRR